MSNKRGKRIWKYSIREIAEAAQVEIHVAQYARTMGDLVPDDLWGMAKWILGKRLEKGGLK